MVKLIVSRKYPFISLADVALRTKVEQLQVENEQLRIRLVDAQEEKMLALKQTEDLRRQKERLRNRVASMKQVGENQRRVQEILEAKLHEAKEEIEALRRP